MVSRRTFLGHLSIIGSGLSATACSTLEAALPGGSLSLGDSLPSGSLKPPIPLDTGFHASVNAQETARSKAIFQALREERRMPFAPGLPSDEEIEAAVAPMRRISEKYPTQTELDTEQTFEVAASLIPILRLFSRLQDLEDLASKSTSPATKRATNSRAGITNGVLNIPPGHMVSLQQKGYCLDAGLPAPGKDEVFRFRPTTELIPEPLIPLYRAMLQRAGKDSSYQNDMQILAWTLRAAGSENGMASHVSPHLLRRMDEAMPGGAQTFINYHNNERAQNKLKDTLGQMFNLQINGKRINPLDFADNKKRDQIFSDLVRDMNRPVPGSHPTDGRNYQMLTPSLATYSVGTGILTPKTWLANAGTNTASVDFGKWIMEPARQAQRVAMLPPRLENMLDAEYLRERLDGSALAATGNKLKKALVDHLPAAARWALTNDKVFIKAVEKTRSFFDTRALGKLLKTTTGRFILDTVPVISNAISLYEFTTGSNAVTGEKLNSLERAAAGLGIVPAGSVLKNAFKGAARIDAVAKVINGLEKSQSLRDGARMAIGGSGMGVSAFPDAPREISNQIGAIAERNWTSLENKMRETMSGLTSSLT